jgi:hypothetical protein
MKPVSGPVPSWDPDGTWAVRTAGLALVFVLGAALGWYAADNWWKWSHQGLYMRGLPPRNASHYALAAIWAVSSGVLAVAVAGWRALTPKDQSESESPAESEGS